ncbi:MAG: V-type ATPase subunit [Chloroflexota bacterium]
MPPGYGYGNARLRAMRSHLLTAADYSALLAKASIEELITALAETPYQKDIEVALVRMEGVRCVFEAVRANLTRTLRQIRGFFEGEPLTLVDLLLRRWDRHNLLTILRGHSQEISPELVLSSIVPVGWQLDEVALRELVHQPGLRAAIDLMTTWRLPYARVLRQAQARADPISGLDQLELALNRSHYASLWAALKPGNGNGAIMLEHLQTEVDLVNISTTLRLARMPGVTALVAQRYHATDVRPLLIEARGHLSTQQLANIVAEGKGVEGVVLELSHTRYGQALEAGWRRYQGGEDSLAVLERELERWQANQTMAMFSRNPLSIAIPIGYIGCKELEAANLRLIAQAVHLDMKREQVRRDLIIA